MCNPLLGCVWDPRKPPNNGTNRLYTRFPPVRPYEAHVAQKKSAARQKAMMREMHLTVSPRSEDVITPEEVWKAENGASLTFPCHPPAKAKMGSDTPRDVRLTLLPFWHL